MQEHWERLVGLYADASVAACMAVHAHPTQCLIRIRIFGLENLRSFQTVDEQGGAAFTIGMREQVEHLQARRIRKVGVVSMGVESEFGIRCVRLG